jgi:hypothetical protein
VTFRKTKLWPPGSTSGGHFSFRYQGSKKPHGNPRGFLQINVNA